MEVSTHFGGSSATFELKHAILLYEDAGRAVAATTHKIANYHGRPTITAGQPITVSALEQLIQSLGKSSGATFLPTEILSLGIERMVWWCPAGRRRIWFKPNGRFDKNQSPEQAAETKALLKLNGQFVQWPAFLFVASHGLSAFAMARSERPKPDTHLLKAPCWNLNDGGMCAGNIELPSVSPDNLAGFENAFFNSSFTHNSQGGKLTTHPGGHTGLWTELAARKTAPDTSYWRKHLLRTNHTVQSVIKNHHE